MTICAVLPAAGRGSRLKAEVPKILLPITPRDTGWSILRNKLHKLVSHIHVVVSPTGEDLMRIAASEDIATGFVSVSVQPEPVGMGDAIFGAHSYWCNADTLLVVWGDQVLVSENTLHRALTQHANNKNQLTLPLVYTANPYVEYIFQSDSLVQIKQTREGDQCNTEGLADVGTFVLSTEKLLPFWQAYEIQTTPGKQTQEINFLPFLPFLSKQGWQVKPLMVDDVIEARGINTREDLLFLRKMFEEVKP